MTSAPSSSRHAEVSLNPDRSARSRVYVLAGLWLAFIVFLAVHGIVRGLGDELFAPRSIAGLEHASAGRPVSAQLQAHADSWLLESVSFVAYAFWFVLPLIAGLAVTRKAPAALLGYFTWILVISVLTDVVFLALPVAPPWMEPGVDRTLLDRPFASHSSEDNNQFAAFPSLHAGLPLLLALFFALGPARARSLAWFCGGYAAVVGFAVVYLGEHWVVDVLAGYGFALVTAWLCSSAAMFRAYARIPGDPVGRFSRWNAGVFVPPERTPVETIPAPAVPRAA